eukprot:TRINITY_DN1907_c0_g1_i2.p2 TRINITY_DN1907_c0_g1~~TRINITY_DN1907_c0_g1_i2.p2  ORF type:complete len:176 (-),score=42.87 TRINITY_DN1907_c0_g1_i2:217-744(-)
MFPRVRQLTSGQKKKQVQVQWGPNLDILVIDYPPGTGDLHISLGQLISLRGAVVVTTPQEVALEDVKRGVNLFQKLKVPVLGVIENMSYYKCPCCNNVDHVFGEDAAREWARDQNIPILGQIPLNISIRKFSDSGQPIVIAAPESEFSQAYLKIGQNLIQILESEINSGPRIVVE